MDFTKEDSTDIILIHSTNIFPYEKIKLNPEADENLQCDNFEFMVKCKVYLSHFKNKQSGYFNLIYKNFSCQNIFICEIFQNIFFMFLSIIKF